MKASDLFWDYAPEDLTRGELQELLAELVLLACKDDLDHTNGLVADALEAAINELYKADDPKLFEHLEAVFEDSEDWEDDDADELYPGFS